MVKFNRWPLTAGDVCVIMGKSSIYVQLDLNSGDVCAISPLKENKNKNKKNIQDPDQL